MDYKRKIDFAIRLLRNIPQDGPIEISYSGGKDSDVILELARMAGIPHEAIYKQTTIDPPGTTAHAKAQGATIIRPQLSFLQIIERKGMPTRRARFCCEVLKEYKVYDRAVQGVRRSESTARAKLYKEPEICRLYPHKEKARIYLPILEWDTEDVARFIEERGIKCAPVYYDPDGTFHPERRLGCIGCPMKSDCGKADFLRYPKLLKQIIRAVDTYLQTHPNCSCKKKMGNAYNVIYQDLFCRSYEEFEVRVTGGLFPENALDTKNYLETYFGIPL
jgi:phosphoadenosine phosphosulfate reductase